MSLLVDVEIKDESIPVTKIAMRITSSTWSTFSLFAVDSNEALECRFVDVKDIYGSVGSVGYVIDEERQVGGFIISVEGSAEDNVLPDANSKSGCRDLG
jgi:hypothetical protein